MSASQIMHLVNGQTVLPVAELPLNEASGTTASDVTGNGWNGTLTGGASWTTGIKGDAVDLSGTSQYVALPAGVVSSDNSITVAAWVNLDTVTNWMRIFDFGSDTSQLHVPDAAKRRQKASSVSQSKMAEPSSRRRDCGAANRRLASCGRNL